MWAFALPCTVIVYLNPRLVHLMKGPSPFCRTFADDYSLKVKESGQGQTATAGSGFEWSMLSTFLGPSTVELESTPRVRNWACVLPGSGGAKATLRWKEIMVGCQSLMPLRRLVIILRRAGTGPRGDFRLGRRKQILGGRQKEEAG